MSVAEARRLLASADAAHQRGITPSVAYGHQNPIADLDAQASLDRTVHELHIRAFVEAADEVAGLTARLLDTLAKAAERTDQGSGAV